VAALVDDIRNPATRRWPSDAHLWAFAEHHALDELISEDFEHGRVYGTVRVRNPFL